MKKDKSIQITRIIAMFSIVLCHLVQQLGISKLAMTAQFFNVGVFIFLFLSGYLYGNKNISNLKSWLTQRFIKLMIPIYIFMAFIFGVQIYQNTFDLKYLFIYILNLQRVLGTVPEASHLWFMTVLMFCYFITPLLNKYKDKICKNYSFLIIWFIISIIICLLHGDTGQILIYMLVYLFGYYYRNNQMNIKSLTSITVIIISLVIRLIGKELFDGTLLYERIIVNITHLTLAFMIYKLVSNSKVLMSKFPDKIINYLDGISLYVYITHCIFMIGPIRTMGLTSNILFNTLLTLIMSYLSASLLKLLTEIITKKLNGGVLK